MSNSTYYKLSAILWLGFFTVITFIVVQQGTNHTVTPAYHLGAKLWLAGKELYDHSGRGFIYFPHSALLFMPLTFISFWSFTAAEIIWRYISLIVLIFALLRFVKLTSGDFVARDFLLLTLLAIPLAFSSARNGQFNLIIAALMLLTVVAVAKENWWVATGWLILGVAFKPTMLVLLLLAWVLYRPLWWRLVVGGMILLLLPFLFHDPSYVIAQYKNCFTMLREVENIGSNACEWSQLFGMLAHFKIQFTPLWQQCLRIIAAVYFLYLGWKTQCYRQNQAAVFLYVLAALYLMLFNPRTENNDYCLLAPILAYFIGVFMQMRNGWLLLGSIAISIGMIFSYNIWLNPLLATALMLLVIQQIYWNKKIYE